MYARPDAPPGAMPMKEALAAGRVKFPPSTWGEDCIFYVRNNHVLLSVFLVHPEHPFGKGRRFMVLANSLLFAYFVMAIVASIESEPGAGSHVFGVFTLIVGTLLQLVWDLFSSMLGACACANCMPSAIGNGCRALSGCLVAAQCFVGLFLALVGLLALTYSDASPHAVWEGFLHTKALAFLLAVPIAVVIFAMLWQCETAPGHAHTAKSFHQSMKVLR